MLVTNESNLEKIRNEFGKAKREILICSAWITSSTFYKVVDHKLQENIKSGKIKLRILIRLGTKDDVKITDPGVFKLIEDLGEHAHLRYHKKLHAKMYVVDDTWAMLGSFNLTGGGFGDEGKPGTNPEAGFEFHEETAVKEVIQRFEDIWNDSDVKAISKSLMGFVMSPSTNYEFMMLGIRDLPMNMFVQIKLHEENEYLVGKITRSEKYDFNFFDAEVGAANFRQQWDLKDFFGKDDLGGVAKAIASVPIEPNLIKVARVLITNKVKLSRGKLDQKDGLRLNTVPPDVATEVHEADKTLLELIFNQENFAPANLFANREIEVGFDPEKLTRMHFSVFGSTGSGKSYFVKRLLSNELYQWFCLKQKGRIIIFDPHDEYRIGKDMPAEFVKDPNRFETIDARQYKARLISDIDDLEEAINLKFGKREEKKNVANILSQAVKGKWKNKQFIQALKKRPSR